MCNSSLFNFDLLPLGNILTNTNDTNHISTYISPGSCIEQYFYTALILRIKRKLKIRSFTPLQGIVKNFLYSHLIFLGDEVLQLYVFQLICRRNE